MSQSHNILHMVTVFLSPRTADPRHTGFCSSNPLPVNAGVIPCSSLHFSTIPQYYYPLLLAKLKTGASLTLAPQACGGGQVWMGSNLCLPLSDVPPLGGSDLSSTGEQYQHHAQGRTLPEPRAWEVLVTHPPVPSWVNKRYSLMWNRECGDSNFFLSFFFFCPLQNFQVS